MMRGQCPRLGQGVGPQGGTDAATTQGRCLWLKLWHERKEASRMEMHSPAAGLGRSGGIGALKVGSKAWGPGLGTGLSGRKLYFNQLAAPTEPGRESVQERKRAVGHLAKASSSSNESGCSANVATKDNGHALPACFYSHMATWGQRQDPVLMLGPCVLSYRKSPEFPQRGWGRCGHILPPGVLVRSSQGRN